MVLALALCSCTAWAQSGSDDSSWRNFVDSVGKSVYFYAWPTATYKYVSFDGVSLVDGGADVSFVVNGISAFDNGPLWTEVVLSIRSGKVTDIRWGKNNAQIAAPGSTMKALGEALDQLSKDYQQQGQQSAPAPAPGGMPIASISAVCIGNPTNDTIEYSLTVDGGKQDHTLAPKTFQIITSNSPSADFVMDYDDSFADGYQGRTIHLPGAPRMQTPTTCDDDLEFDFVEDDQLIGLSPKKWIPGFEHPFMPNVLRSDKEGVWVCAPEQTWANQDDVNDLTCVPK